MLPERNELDEAAGVLFEHKDWVQERFGITAFQAFEKLVSSTIKRRLRIVPLTRRFIETLT